ncbi:Maleamate amidohydrolase [Aquimixticola soesokkakensis]|uniref:Maleamate amidohydrolase n=1 Tax=Aquimixticola soesokkakensis TaxID=1519096 RepID=A0A1Y5T9W0_9RHOB|nr:isochorismatase family protein [Aquimixticola soesokkakensis]SLN57180.1 Maleamate amidohydrolase [Aquimixticola soesokkakensis]
MAKVWDSFLTEDDKKFMAARKNLRQPHGPGKHMALLVIDMQVTAIGENLPIVEQIEKFPGNCGPHAWKSIPVQQDMIAAARAADMPVIYSKHIFHAYAGFANAASGVFSENDPRSEIPPEVAMQKGDILVEKQTPSCFAFTNLHLIAKEKGIDGFLVMGNSTSGCVRATCVDGEAMGYKMQVIEEGVFDRIEMSHAAALFDMQFKICDVLSASEALEVIGAPAALAKSA